MPYLIAGPLDKVAAQQQNSLNNRILIRLQHFDWRRGGCCDYTVRKGGSDLKEMCIVVTVVVVVVKEVILMIEVIVIELVELGSSSSSSRRRVIVT